LILLGVPVGVWILVAFAAGLILGRSLGWTEGLGTGLARAPLDLRRRALETARCPICGSGPRQCPSPPGSVEEG